MSPMLDVRPAAVAGTWYPGTAAQLTRAVDAYLARVPGGTEICPRALIAPHAGLMYSGPVAAYAYSLVRDCSYSAVVLVGPSHFVEFHGVASWPHGKWQTPLGDVAVASEIADAIAARSPLVRAYAAAHGREHSLEMQLPFLKCLLVNVPIVPLLMGYQTRDTAEALGDALADALATRDEQKESPGALLVASSDLSHYKDAGTAGRMDAVVLRHVEALDPDGLMHTLEREPHHACGGGPIVSVLRAARRLGAGRAKVLRYADSGDVSGDKTAVVGYMAAAVW
jgi:AmmeMemoRadiSam system protein B